LKRTAAESVVLTADAPVPTHVFWVNATELGRWLPSRLTSVARRGLDTAIPPGASAARFAEHPDTGLGTAADGAGVEADVGVAEDVRDEDDVRVTAPPPHAVTPTASASAIAVARPGDSCTDLNASINSLCAACLLWA